MTTERMDRMLALACDRALSGINPSQEMELVSQMTPGVRLDAKLELAAAAIALSELSIDEPLPAKLAASIFANAQRTNFRAQPAIQGGTIPIGRHVAEARTIALPSSLPSSPPSLVGSDPASAPANNVIALAPKRSRFVRALPWMAAAACLALAIGSYVRGQTGSPKPPAPVAATLSPADARARLLADAKDVVTTPWASTKDGAGQGETGDVVWSPSRQEGYMTFKAVATNDPRSTQYQLWIFDAARDERYPVDGGVFDVDASKGTVTIPISAKVGVSNPKLFAVTVEKPGGVVVSQRERIVVTATPS